MIFTESTIKISNNVSKRSERGVFLCALCLIMHTAFMQMKNEITYWCFVVLKHCNLKI